jgi:hypothetical protein
MKWPSYAVARFMRLVRRWCQVLHPGASVDIRRYIQRGIPWGVPRVTARDTACVRARVRAPVKGLRAVTPACVLIAMISAFAPMELARAAGVGTCTGQFPNPITDICWSCILPISIGGVRLGNLGARCAAAAPTRLSVSPWGSGNPSATSRPSASRSAWCPWAASI